MKHIQNRSITTNRHGLIESLAILAMTTIYHGVFYALAIYLVITGFGGDIPIPVSLGLGVGIASLPSKIIHFLPRNPRE